jgi:hypothetical protein
LFVGTAAAGEAKAARAELRARPDAQLRNRICIARQVPQHWYRRPWFQPLLQVVSG